ncbi:MAG: AAA family ATPase, partial [Chloroflexota bacterium]
MLNRLLISNYALIRDLNIEFEKQFSVITGETGAGKSIILGALSLILGSRADNLMLPDPSRKCTIEGTFDISKCELEDFFEENNLDYDTNCIIRREITPQGKSRAFINDTPVNLNQIKELTSQLIDVHSQHQTLLLRENSFQLSVVDAVANNQKLLKEYHDNFRNYQRLIRELEIVKEQNIRAKTELDYLVFIVDEFRKTSLVAGEQQELEEELDIQSHAEEIKTRLFNAIQLLTEDDANVLRRLKEILNLLNTASVHFADLKSLTERLDSCLVELKDIAEVITDTEERISYNPQRIEQLNERLNQIYKLEQKHHVKTVEELLVLASEFEMKI